MLNPTQQEQETHYSEDQKIKENDNHIVSKLESGSQTIQTVGVKSKAVTF